MLKRKYLENAYTTYFVYYQQILLSDANFDYIQVFLQGHRQGH